MAESSVSLAHDRFSCLICLDQLKDPVTIPCGHSYCMSCISDCWDQDDQRGVYSCPQCRQTFTPRPALGKNTIPVPEILYNLRKRKPQAACRTQSESGDVECDICTGRKYQAIKSCLVCLESYCHIHFEHHEEFHSIKQHKVTDATVPLQAAICPQHNRLLEMYCRTDQRCICMLCMVNEHKSHETVLADEERAEKQKHLKETRRNFQQRIQERQKELQQLRETMESHKRSAQAAIQDSERILTELIHSIERSHSEVISVSQVEGLSEQLNQEIDELRKKDAKLKQLSHTDHHVYFLQSFQSLSVPPGSPDSPNISSHIAFEDLLTLVSHLKEKLQQTLKEEKENLIQTVRRIKIIPTLEYQSKDEFQQYYQRFTLDSNTVYKSVKLSEENRVVSRMKHVLRYPDHPDKFDDWSQVLCVESVRGRCYWEVEWSGDVEVAVSYKIISKKKLRRKCRFGRNDQSWSLYCSNSRCLFRHNNKRTKLPVVSSSSRIGVYVDHSAGTLSYYSVSDTMSLIHRVHTTFTQPLYPGFGVCYYSQVKLCDQG